MDKNLVDLINELCCEYLLSKTYSGDMELDNIYSFKAGSRAMYYILQKELQSMGDIVKEFKKKNDIQEIEIERMNKLLTTFKEIK